MTRPHSSILITQKLSS